MHFRFLAFHAARQCAAKVEGRLFASLFHLRTRQDGGASYCLLCGFAAATFFCVHEGAGRESRPRRAPHLVSSPLALLSPSPRPPVARAAAPPFPSQDDSKVVDDVEAPAKGKKGAKASGEVAEVVRLGPVVREGEQVFGVAHIYASFNDTFVHVTDMRCVLFCLIAASAAGCARPGLPRACTRALPLSTPTPTLPFPARLQRPRDAVSRDGRHEGQGGPRRVFALRGHARRAGCR